MCRLLRLDGRKLNSRKMCTSDIILRMERFNILRVFSDKFYSGIDRCKYIHTVIHHAV